ncbi:MAG: NAD(P)/FAD-dependent oxidoreductase [Scytolyngbya sp. HA4215-MV1]|nr:NAD(P)/FAD-dependent oxidoreductase [Scytolyngbya sp. HA4215-MV1]
MGQTRPTRICILGGGFGGLYTALYLQKFAQLRSPHYEITLVEQRDNFLFTPLLYEVVTGELQPWHIAPPYQKLLTGKNVHFCQDSVQDVDLNRRSVHLQSGKTLHYDYLVLAVGSSPQLNWVPGAATHAQTFRSLADAEHLRERLRFLEASDRPIIRVAIAGGGPNGVEIACKIADRLKHRVEVRLIERGDQILKTFTPGSRKFAYRALKERGIQLHLDTSITAIEADQITLSHQGDVKTLPTDLVLWTAGTQIVDWVKQLPCQHNPQGQLFSLPTLQLTNYPEVFALGDLAEIQNPGKPKVPATAQAAYQQADCAAQNLWRAIKQRPLLQFRYLHLGEMMTLGQGESVVSSFGITLGGALAQVIRQWVYAQRLPTLHHRCQVMLHWIGQGILKCFPRQWQPHLRQTSKKLATRPRFTSGHADRRAPY